MDKRKLLLPFSHLNHLNLFRIVSILFLLIEIYCNFKGGRKFFFSVNLTLNKLLFKKFLSFCKKGRCI